MEPQDPARRLEYLERLADGLEQTCESLRFEIPYYKPDDIQGRYAKKFLAAVEENLVQTRTRIADLRRSLPPVARPEGE